MSKSSRVCSSNEGDNIKVYVRVRPPAKNLENGVDSMPCIEVTSANSIQLLSKPDPKTFSYDHVADINTMQVRDITIFNKKYFFNFFFFSRIIISGNQA